MVFWLQNFLKHLMVLISTNQKNGKMLKGLPIFTYIYGVCTRQLCLMKSIHYPLATNIMSNHDSNLVLQLWHSWHPQKLPDVTKGLLYSVFLRNQNSRDREKIEKRLFCLIKKRFQRNKTHFCFFPHLLRSVLVLIEIFFSFLIVRMSSCPKWRVV